MLQAHPPSSLPAPPLITFLFGGAILVLFSYLLWLGPLMASDTGGYLEISNIRSPLYPLLLSLNRVFFEGFFVLCTFQLALGFGAVGFLTRTMKQLLALDVWVSYLIFLLLLSPYYGYTLFGNFILTEAVCYPMFLILLSYLLKGLKTLELRPFLLLFIWTTLLILTRRQFLFIYPVFACVLVYWLIFSQKRKAAFLATFVFLGSIIGTNILEKSYNYFQFGHFSTIPFTGMQLINAPLFVSTGSDVHHLKTDLEKKVFQETRALMVEKKVTLENSQETDPFYLPPEQRFKWGYTTILFQILLPTLRNNGIENPYEVDRFTLSMALSLIQNNLSAYGTLLTKNVIINMGGYVYFMVVGLSFLISFVTFFRTRSFMAVGLFFAILMQFSNYALITLVEPILMRYTAYTDVFLACFFVACVHLLVKKRLPS